MNNAVLKKEEEKFKMLLIKDLLDRLGFEGEDQYVLTIDKNEKVRNHRSNYVNEIHSIAYAPSLKKSGDDIPLYIIKGNSYYSVLLQNGTLRETIDLIDVIDEVLDFEIVRKNYSIYNKIKDSNLLERSELNKIELMLSKDSVKLF